MKRNIEEAAKALVEKPLLATSAERFLILDELKSSYKELPQPLRFSKILSELLARVSVPLEEYDLLAGRCVDRLLTEEEEAQFQAFLAHPDHPARRLFWSSGHCTYSWEMLVEEGLRARVHARAETASPRQREFLTAIAETYDAITAYMLRYAEAAQRQGLTETAENLRTAAAKAPDTFASALQLLWTVTLIDCAYIAENPTLTVGRLDLFLYPLSRADIDKGILAPSMGKEYVTDYYCKHNGILERGTH